MASRKYKAHRPINHDGKLYSEGSDALALTDEQAAPLLACGAISPIDRNHDKKADKAPAKPQNGDGDAKPEGDGNQSQNGDGSGDETK